MTQSIDITPPAVAQYPSREMPIDITLMKIEPGRFRLANENQILGFLGWDKDVLNLDPNAKPGRVLSRRLMWEEVELTSEEVRASSPQRAQAALRRVTICFV